MNIFEWEGWNKNREFKTGAMEAPSKNAVHLRLMRLGITPDRIKKKRSKLFKKIPFAGPSVPKSSIILFARQFSAMIDAGMPIVKCFDLLCEREKNREFKRVLEKIKKWVEDGETLADALGKYPEHFDSMFSNMVAAGEKGGVLDEILIRLAKDLEKAEKVRKKVGTAMIYPLATLIVSMVVTGVILVFVIPVFRRMFLDMGGQIPFATRLVIALSDGLKQNIVYIFAAMASLFFGIRSFYKRPKGRLFIDAMKLKSPLFGPLVRKSVVANFSRAMAAMLKSGVAILDAFDTVSKTIENRAMQVAASRVKEEISDGRPLNEALYGSGVFPPMVCQMVSIGESTGALDAVFEKIADFYDDEVDAFTENIMALIEPAMMIFLGITVGGLIVSLYLPIFKMASILN